MNYKIEKGISIPTRGRKSTTGIDYKSIPFKELKVGESVVLLDHQPDRRVVNSCNCNIRTTLNRKYPKMRVTIGMSEGKYRLWRTK